MSAEPIAYPPPLQGLTVRDLDRLPDDGIQVVAYQLNAQGEYVEKAQARAGNLFIAAEPFAVKFDPAGLLP